MKFTGASNKGNAMNACVRVLVTMKFTGERYERMRAGFSNHEIYRGLKLRHPYTDADRVLVTMKSTGVSNCLIVFCSIKLF